MIIAATVSLAVTISGVGCTRTAVTTPVRIAVLRFENLTPDKSLDWMGRAASEIIAREIGTGHSTVLSAPALHANALAQFRPLSAPGESGEREAAIAEGATRIVMGQISFGRNGLVLDVTERDPAASKTIRAFSLTSPDRTNLYAAADAAARRLAPQITPFDSANNQAIAAWARGLEESDPSKVSSDYAAAVQADPNFASAWLAWAGNASGHNDRSTAEKILGEAQQHAGGFSDVNRLRLKLSAAQLSGDRTAVLAALNGLARLRPGDVDTVRALAEQNFAARRFQEAASAYRSLTRITPQSPLAWNQLGYALMYSGDYAGAMSALQTYQQISPNDPNPFDSQGDVAFAFGRFSEAEKLYQRAAEINAGFENSSDLAKSANARLMTGDVAGADKKFEAYAAARRSARDVTLPFRAAQWRFLSGRHADALAMLATLASSTDPQFQTSQFKALVLTQMAIWDLQLGRRDRAAGEAAGALKTGAAPPTAIIAQFASEDASTPADWSSRADRMLAAPQLAPLKSLALAYALYMAHQWQAAEPLWKQLTARGASNDPVTPLIYAHILVELKRPREAQPLVALFPLPQPNASQEFASLAIPQIFATRGAVFASEGKTTEAEASQKVFRTLWGGQ